MCTDVGTFEGQASEKKEKKGARSGRSCVVVLLCGADQQKKKFWAQILQ